MSPAFILLVGMAVAQVACWRRLVRIDTKLGSLGEVHSVVKGLVVTQDYDHREIGRVVTDLETALQESVTELRIGANTLGYLKDFLVSELPSRLGANGRPHG